MKTDELTEDEIREGVEAILALKEAKDMVDRIERRLKEQFVEALMEGMKAERSES